MRKFFGLKFLFISIAIFLSYSVPAQAQFYNTQDEAQNGQDGDDTTLDDTESDPTANDGLDGTALAPPVGDIQSRYNSHNLDVLGNDLVGDHIDLDTGALSITHTDVSIPGNFALPVEFGRTLSRSFVGADWVGNWQANVPYIARNYLQQIPLGNDRCSGDLYPQPIDYNNVFIFAPSYFDGINLSVPGRNSGKLAEELNGGNSPEFSGASASARMVTKNNWFVKCTPSIANGNGEGFEATAPNGDRYTFAHRQSYFDRNVEISSDDGVTVMKEFLYVTEVKDVHDNWVRYEYTGDNLTRIHASDLREITFTYSAGKISTVTANGRIWTYAYNANKLTNVTLPDGRFWDISTSPGVYPLNSYATGICAGHNSTNFYSDLHIKHPSGTEAIFSFTTIMNGRTNVTTQLPAPNHVHPGIDQCFVGDHAYPNSTGFYSIAVTQKQLVLPSGGPTYVWTRDYEQDPGYNNVNGNSQNLSDLKKRTVTDPLGHKTVSYFNRRYDQYEGNLQKVEVIPFGSPIPIETTTHTYLAGNYVGKSLVAVEHGEVSNFTDTSRMYKKSTTIQRNGDTFTSTFDYDDDETSSTFSYGNPTETQSWSNYVISDASKKRETVTTYDHNKTKWILGLPETVTRNGRLLSTKDYTPLGQLDKTFEYGQTTPIADYSYHLDGTIASITDALGRITEADNWKRGKPQLIKRAAGTSLVQITSKTIDDNGWVMSESDPKGYIAGYATTFERDNMGRLTKIIPHSPPSGPSIPSTNIVYTWHASSIHQRITTGNKRNFVYYDSLHRPYLELTYDFTTAKFTWTRKVHDALGRLTFTSYPSASAGEPDGMSTEYDALGRVTETKESTTNAATQYEYLIGHRKKVTDPEGNITYTYSYGYDGPDTGDSYLIRQPLDVDTFTFRNVHGEVTRVSQNGIQNGISLNKSQYFYYDNRQRLCRYRTSEGGDTLYGYNVGGEMTSYAKGRSSGTTCGAFSGTDVVDQSYDDLGRLETTSFNDGVTPNITRGYDQNSNLTLLTRGTTPNEVKWEYFYDSYNRITDEELSIDGKSFDTTYRYNSLGHMFGKYLPSGRYISYTNDGLGRHVRVGEPGVNGQAFADNVSYHPSGQIDTLTYGNGQVFTQALDSRRMLYTLKVTDGVTSAQDMQYNYDLNARVQYQTNFLNPDDTRYYQYDALGRLKQANSNRWAQADYTYDALGNLRSKHFSGWYNGVNGGPRTVTNTYDSKNRIYSSTDSATINYGFNHDARGNVTQTGNLHFTYDMADQPTVMSGTAPNTGTSVTASYVYDGNMKRVKAVVNGKTIYNVYDSTGRLVHVDEDTDGKETDYLHGMGQTLARIKDSGNGDVFTYLHPDHLGSPQAGTNEAGGLAWTEHYTPFGEALIGNAANDNQSGFTGHIKDKATGLNYMQARYYDPKIGRFLSIDPVTFLQTGDPRYFNRYSYSANDPINKIDRTGRNFVPVHYVTAIAENKADPSKHAGLAAGHQRLQEEVYDLTLADGVNAVQSVAQGDLKGAAAAATLAVVKPAKVLDKANDIRKKLPKIDGTGKMHGDLPEIGDLKKHVDKDTLGDFRDDLKSSAKRRQDVTDDLGADAVHSGRQTDELDLAKSLDKFLDD